MKRSRLTYFGVVLLLISIGALAAMVMPAIAQEEAAAEQPDDGVMVDDEAIEVPMTIMPFFGDTSDPLVPISSEADDSPVCETVRLHYMRDIDALQMLLESIKEGVAPDVSVAATASPAPLMVLAGPRSQVDDLKRVIAAIDVPQPQVRLALWARYASPCGPFRLAATMRKLWPGERRRRRSWRKQWAILCAAICANWRPVRGPRNSVTRKQQSKPNSRRPPLR